MPRSRRAFLRGGLAAAACAAITAAAPASAPAYGGGNFCQSVLIDSGNTCIAANPRNIIYVSGRSITEAGGAGNASTCVGGKTYQSASAAWAPAYVCGNPGQPAQTPSYNNGYGCCTWPAIHNHSTFLSRFTGFVSWFD